MKEKERPVGKEKPTKLGSSKKQILINSLATIAFVFLTLNLTALQNKDFIFKLQDLSLFLPTKMFFRDVFVVPGGFLAYIGLFFTQFFYHPWLGSLIFLLLLFLVQFLALKAFQLNAKQFPLSFIPSLFLLLMVTQLGYNLFISTARGYAFSNLAGTAVALGAFWAYRNIKRPNYRLWFSLLFTIAFFHLIGFYALLAGLLFIVYELVALKKNNMQNQLMAIAVSLLTIIMVPMLYYRFISVSTSFPNVYLAALPEYFSNDFVLWLPFIALFAFLILANFNYLPAPKTQKPRRLSLYFPILVFLATLLGVHTLSFNDENYRTELAMERAIYKNNWHEVLNLSRRLKDEPTRLIVMDTYLALRKLNIAGDKMFAYKNGNKPQKTRLPILLMDMAGRMLYYHYGKLNYCYRWCMEDMMNTGMKIDNLKYFVKSCLLNNEITLAKKYNDLLMKTLFHKAWAKKYQKYIDDPGKIPADPEFKEILPLLDFENNLYAEKANMFEIFLMYSFAASNPKTPKLMELALQCNMEYKNIQGFWPFFAYYANTHDKLPVHYQEAALLFALGDKTVDVSRVKFDKEVSDNFREFVNLKLQYAKTPKEKLKPIFHGKFSKTYWYYYYFFEHKQMNNY